MRIYFASDLHGSEKCWRKFLNTPKFYDADVIIVGGDIAGKSLIPIVRDGNGAATLTYRGRARTAKTPEELAQVEQQIAFGGDYSVVLTRDEFDEVSADDTKREKIFLDVVLQRVAEWVALADERLDPSIGCFVSCGNDDFFEMDDVLASGRAIVVPDGRAVGIGDGIQMIGVGYANQTPWDCPRDITEEELTQRIDAATALLSDLGRAVFDIHVPPYDSGLDNAPLLTADLAVVRGPGGETQMVPVGSTAVREAILRYEPMLGLHGHVHESKGVQMLGATTIVNPGSEYQEGLLHGAIIDIDARKNVRAQLVSG